MQVQGQKKTQEIINNCKVDYSSRSFNDLPISKIFCYILIDFSQSIASNHSTLIKNRIKKIIFAQKKQFKIN